MMSAEEKRLADLLRRAVPEPPRELSADQVTARRAGQPRGPAAGWARPTLAAAAVLAIGVTTGVAVRHASPGAQSAPRGSGQSATSAPSPGCSPARPGRNVTAPNVIGMAAVQAEQILAQDGLTVKVVASMAPAGQHVPAGTVFSQSPAAGATVSTGAAITVTVAANVP
jgi:hypothetical protein